MNRIDRIPHSPLTLPEIATELRAMLVELGRYETGTEYSVVMRVRDEDRQAASALMINIWREFHPGTDPFSDEKNSI